MDTKTTPKTPLCTKAIFWAIVYLTSPGGTPVNNELNKLEVSAISVFSARYMHDEAAAFARVGAMLWADGAVCPHCGVVDKAYRLEGVRTKAGKKHPEGKERCGLWKWCEYRKQFTVRKGMIFEESHLPLHLWLQAIHLMVSGKKGIGSH